MLQNGAWFIFLSRRKKRSTEKLIIPNVMLIIEFIFELFKQNHIK